MISGALIMMFVTSSALSLVVIGVIPLILVPIILFGRLVRKRSRKAQDSLAEASALAAENLGAIRTLQAFTSEAAISKRFSGAVETSFNDARSRLVARALMTAMAIFLVVGSIVGVLWFGASMVDSLFWVARGANASAPSPVASRRRTHLGASWKPWNARSCC